VIPSKALQLINGKSTIEFDVANNHPNELNSVSIKPEAEGVKFYPAEYFIGPMDPDELFTIEFDAVADNSSDSNGDTPKVINMTLSASYGNGVNKHENTVSNLYIQSVEANPENSSGMFVVGLLILIGIVAGVFIYRKKIQNKK